MVYHCIFCRKIVQTDGSYDDFEQRKLPISSSEDTVCENAIVCNTAVPGSSLHETLYIYENHKCWSRNVDIWRILARKKRKMIVLNRYGTSTNYSDELI